MNPIENIKAAERYYESDEELAVTYGWLDSADVKEIVIEAFCAGVQWRHEKDMARAENFLKGVNNLAFLGMPTIDIEMFKEHMK